MGGRPVCVLRGHGITTTGSTLRAGRRLRPRRRLAGPHGDAASTALGGTPTARPDADLAQLPDLGSAFNDELLWRTTSARLATRWGWRWTGMTRDDLTDAIAAEHPRAA